MSRAYAVELLRIFVTAIELEGWFLFVVGIYDIAGWYWNRIEVSSTN
jgi:hypothetical protein